MIRSLDINSVQSTYIENDKLIFKMKDGYLIDRFEASVGVEIQISEYVQLPNLTKKFACDICYLTLMDSGQIIICDYTINMYEYCYDYEVHNLISIINRLAEREVGEF